VTGFSGQEWDEFTRLALAEGVGPWLQWALRNNELKNQFPSHVSSALAGAYYQSAARNQVLFAALDRITTTFNHAGIPIQPLKGAALAGTLYPNPALRLMSDLDLLIKPADLLPALALLDRLGYHTQKITYHAVLSGGPGGDIPVELHWCLPDGQAVPETWWEAAAILEPGMTASRPAGPFGLVEHLLYLSAHLLLQHGDWPRLIWLLDLRLLVGRISEKEMTRAFAIARSVGWENLLHMALEITRQPRMRGPAPQSPALDIAHLLAIPTGDAWRLRRAWVLLGWRAKARLLSGLLFPAPRYLRWKYNPQPQWLWPVFYLRRWAELARQVNLA
jgi:hypothetical protein